MFKTLLAAAVTSAFLLGLGAAPAGAQNKASNLVERARLTIEDFAIDDTMKPMRDLIKRARGVVIVPALVRGGFIVGGAGGNGVILAYDEETGTWSDPGFVAMVGGSIGLQIGGEVRQLVLAVMSEKGLEALIKNKFTLGADASVAAGPVGIAGRASSTTNIDADVLAFARSQGLYAGLSLEGVVIDQKSEFNEAYYGYPTTNADILLANKTANPHAEPLKKALGNLQATP